MPTETFFNLPEEKKSRIIAAIKKEFARVPYDKVSINKVIQDADISRGSFYMYFEDKKDMLMYVLSSYNDKINSIIMESFKKNHGDIFVVFSEILNFTCKFGTSKENIDFCRNIFSNPTLQQELALQYANCGKRKEHFYWFKQYVDINNLNLQNLDDIYDIMDILVSVTQKAIVDIFLYIEERDMILENYKNKIDILKRGMLKEN